MLLKSQAPKIQQTQPENASLRALWGAGQGLGLLRDRSWGACEWVANARVRRTPNPLSKSNTFKPKAQSPKHSLHSTAQNRSVKT